MKAEYPKALPREIAICSVSIKCYSGRKEGGKKYSK